MTEQEKRGVIKQYCLGRRCSDCALNKPEYMDPEEPDTCFDFDNAPIDALTKHVEAVLATGFTTTPDNVRPNHYKLPNGMQVVDVEVAMFGKEAVQAHCLCTAVEYVLRHKGKNGAEDIHKAHWWLEKYIDLEGAAE